jgi:alpha-tubulin suppressor-like RCC1 family protein
MKQRLAAVFLSLFLLTTAAYSEVFGWGFNDSKQATVPIELLEKTVVTIAAGSTHSLALTDTGEVKA